MVAWINFAYAGPSWQQDAEIDKKLNLINLSWDISFVRIKSFDCLTKRIKKDFPPYSQHPEDAQKETAPLTNGNGPSGPGPTTGP